MFSLTNQILNVGFIKIPIVTKDKIAMIEWGDIKGESDRPKIHERMKERNITQYGLANLAGEINDIIVLDIDVPKLNSPYKVGFEDFEKLIKDEPQTLTYRTQNGGLHYYYKYDSECRHSCHKANG